MHRENIQVAGSVLNSTGKGQCTGISISLAAVVPGLEGPLGRLVQGHSAFLN